MDKSALKKAYLQNPPEAGIFKITNTVNGKIFIGKGINVKGIINSQQSQLKWHSHMNVDLQADWDHYGAETFVFEVIDRLDAGGHAGDELVKDLAELEQLWLEKLRPYGETGYNRPPKAAD
jgi:hypothetical protein